MPTIRGSSFEHNTAVFLSEPTHKHGEERIYRDIAPTIQARYGTGGDNIPYVSNIRRLTEIDPKRLAFAKENIQALGYAITFDSNTEIRFEYKGNTISLFPYSGWHSGKGLQQVEKLINF